MVYCTCSVDRNRQIEIGTTTEIEISIRQILNPEGEGTVVRRTRLMVGDQAHRIRQLAAGLTRGRGSGEDLDYHVERLIRFRPRC